MQPLLYKAEDDGGVDSDDDEEALSPREGYSMVTRHLGG
jgi:hypothetical protein